MKNLTRLLRSRVVKTLAVILALTLAWQAFLTVQAPSRIDADVAASVEKGEPLRVSVELGFAPERFHTLFLQDYGRVMGVSGNQVHLRDVRPESVGMLARIYWIDQIRPYEEKP